MEIRKNEALRRVDEIIERLRNDLIGIELGGVWKEDLLQKESKEPMTGMHMKSKIYVDKDATEDTRIHYVDMIRDAFNTKESISEHEQIVKLRRIEVKRLASLYHTTTRSGRSNRHDMAIFIQDRLFLNPSTKESWSLDTVKRDLNFLKVKFMEESDGKSGKRIHPRKVYSREEHNSGESGYECSQRETEDGISGGDKI